MALDFSIKHITDEIIDKKDKYYLEALHLKFL